MPCPLQEPHPSSPNFILEGACPTSSVKMNIISCGAVSLHCLFSTYTIWPMYRQKHTGHSLLNGKFPRKRDSPPLASDLSFSIPRYQGQKRHSIYTQYVHLSNSTFNRIQKLFSLSFGSCTTTYNYTHSLDELM